VNTSNVIVGVVGNGNYNVVGTITQWDYGYIFRIEGVELPAVYRVDFATDRHYGEALTAYGNEDGVEIPEELIATGKDIYAFYYFIGDEYGKTAHTWRIQNDLRARTSDRQPTPSQQDSIDQAIARVNEAVETTEEAAQSAREDADLLRNASAEATTLPSRSEATAVYSDGVFSFGIPKGIDAITMDVETEAILINANSDGKLTSIVTVEIVFKVYDGDTLVVPTAIDATTLEGTPPIAVRSTTNKVAYNLPYNKQMQYDNGSVTISATYGGKTITHVIPYAVIKSAAEGVTVHFGRNGAIFRVQEDNSLASAMKLSIPVRVRKGGALVKPANLSGTSIDFVWEVHEGGQKTIRPIFPPDIINPSAESNITYSLPANKPFVSESATVTLSVTYAGVVYTMLMPWSIVKDGAQGEPGPKGDTGMKYVKDDPSDNGGVIEGNVTANSAAGLYAHAEGRETTADASYAHAEGYSTQATGMCAHAEGAGTTARADNSHAEGIGNTASANNAHVEGERSTASARNAHAEGEHTTASEIGAHSEGASTTASGEYSHAEGGNTIASGNYSHSEGGAANATGSCSHAEGASTTASGDNSHAEGGGTRATGGQAHAEGGGTQATGSQSHAEGTSTVASGNSAHAEGATTTASGNNSHAEGLFTEASGGCSHASGLSTIAQRKSQMVIGENNVADTGGNSVDSRGEYVFIAGNGISPSDRSNAFAIKWDGTLVFGNGTEITPTQVTALLALLNN